MKDQQSAQKTGPRPYFRKYKVGEAPKSTLSPVNRFWLARGMAFIAVFSLLFTSVSPMAIAQEADPTPTETELKVDEPTPTPTETEPTPTPEEEKGEVAGDQSNLRLNFKVDICHKEGNGSYHQIEISVLAVIPHVLHGDIYPVPENGCPVALPTPPDCPWYETQISPEDIFHLCPTVTPTVTPTPTGEPTPTETEETIIVTGDTASGENQPGWMFNRDASTSTPFAFQAGNQLIGTGSLNVLPIGSNPSDKFIGENFINSPIDDIEYIKYNFKIGSGGDSNDEEQFYMSVYANFGSSPDNKFYDCRYSVVPTSGSTGSYTEVEFDPTQNYPVTQHGTSPFACPSSPSGMDALSDGSTIRMFALNVGDTSNSDQGIDGYLDKVVTKVVNHKTTYDFEPKDEDPTPVPCGEEMVKNGTFEAPIVTNGAGWDIVPDGTAGFEWDVDWAWAPGGPATANAELHRGVNGWNSQGGSQHTELDSDWGGPSSPQSGEPASARISQKLGTITGHTYTVTFYTSPRPGVASNHIKSYINGVEKANVVENGTGNSNTVWTLRSYAFIATGAVTTISFEDDSNSDSLGSFLDTVSVKEDCGDNAPNLHFIKVSCTELNDIAGNEDADNADETGGDYTQFSNYNGGTFLPSPLVDGFVDPSEIPTGEGTDCEREDGWMFSLATNFEHTNDVSLVGPTTGGEFVTPAYGPGSALNVSQQNAIVNGQLWIKEVEQDGYEFAAIRCYNDALNGDKVEFITLDEEVPDDIYCIAYNVDLGSDLHFYKYVCLDYSDIRGNAFGEVYDATGGHFDEFSNYSVSNPHFPDPYVTKPVNPSNANEVSENCHAEDGWQFKLSSDLAQTENIFVTDPTDVNGEVVLNVGNLPEPLWHAFNNSTLWVSEILEEGYGFGALRCYTDAINGDNLEVILFNGEEQPDDIYCIAYNVQNQDNPDCEFIFNDLVKRDAILEDNENIAVDGPICSISGRKFSDDGDNEIDEGDSVLSGWVIYLDLNQNGSLDSGEPYDVTDENGFYSFNNLESGTTYQVREVNQANWAQIYPAAYHQETPTGFPLTNRDFLNKFVPPCEQTSLSIVSGFNTLFKGLTETQPGSLDDDGAYSGGGFFSVTADDLGFDGAWNGALSDPDISSTSAVWVSNSADQPSSPDTGNGDSQNTSWRLFSHTFSIPSGAVGVSQSQLHVTADNSVVVFLDGEQIGSHNDFATVTDINLPALSAGNTYTLEFAVKNDGLSNEDNPSKGEFNPTGLLYALGVGYACDGGGNGGDLSISGKVYSDENNNGNNDSENGLSGWVIYIDKDTDGDNTGNNALDEDEQSTTSDSNGNYSLNGLLPGCYTVREVAQGGWDQTEPSDAEDNEYRIGIGGASCDEESLIESLFTSAFKTAEAAVIIDEIAGSATDMNFGNFSEDNGGGSNGGGGGGFARPTPTPTGFVLGDSISFPTDNSQVLGASTELPRTGLGVSPMGLVFFLLVLLTVLIPLKKGLQGSK